MPESKILSSLKSRASKRHGVTTADRYFRGIEACFTAEDQHFCPAKLFAYADSAEWQAKLTEAEQKLVYSNRDMVLSSHKAADEDSGPGIMQFDAVVTTTRRDRDLDILETKGATLDEAMPLLWQHITMQPIGALVRKLEHTDKKLSARFVIADTDLGRDAAELILVGALRISHGFEPQEFEPLKDEGWRFLKFLIYESSLVSIPSNIDAVIEAFSREKLHSPLVRGWAEKMFKDRPVQGVGYETLTTDALDLEPEQQKQLRLQLKEQFSHVDQHLHNDGTVSFKAKTEREYGELVKENALTIDEARQLLSKSCSCQKGVHGDDEKLQCPECGFKNCQRAINNDMPCAGPAEQGQKK